MNEQNTGTAVYSSKQGVDRASKRGTHLKGVTKLMKKSLSIAMFLVFALALAAGAQQPGSDRPNKQRQPVAGQPGAAPMHRGDGLGKMLTGLDFSERGEGYYKFVNLQRALLPPTRKELQTIATAVGLTEDQKAKIIDLYKQFQATVKPITERRAAATKELLDNMQSASPSKGAFESAQAKVAQADREILDAEYNFWVAFRGVMTPQQGEAVNKLMQDRVMMFKTNNPPQPKPDMPQPLPPAPKK